MNLTSTNISIAGQSYTLKLDENSLPAVEQAASFINDHISEFEKKYPVKEKRDLLAMASLEMITELLKKQEQQNTEIHRLKTLLNELNNMVENHSKSVQL
ncbi:MAG: cell division protein ZapA [Bacteroidetes bacterium]|nr:cell division protein ZapA [Bacteroidota bacterium]